MRRVALLAIVGSACGGSDRRPVLVEDMSEVRRDAAIAGLVAASVSHDASRLRELFDDDLTYGGMWFADATCRSSLAAGKVDAAELARCVAPLTLQPSTRSHPYSNVAVLTYAPGIEIEVMFHLASAKVRWIGYAGRRADDTLPMVSQSALEAYRIDPVPVALPAETIAALEQEAARLSPPPNEVVPYAWLRICIDAKGDIADVQARAAPTLRVRDAFIAHVGTWRFRPFLLDGKPAPVCSLVGIEQPADSEADTFPFPVPSKHPGAIVVAPWGTGKRLEGVTLAPPDDKDKTEFSRRGFKKVGALLNYCVSDDGRVDWVQMSTPSGLPRWDAKLTRVVGAWRFEPPAEPVCATVVFIYSQR